MINVLNIKNNILTLWLIVSFVLLLKPANIFSLSPETNQSVNIDKAVYYESTYKYQLSDQQSAYGITDSPIEHSEQVPLDQFVRESISKTNERIKDPLEQKKYSLYEYWDSFKNVSIKKEKEITVIEEMHIRNKKDVFLPSDEKKCSHTPFYVFGSDDSNDDILYSKDELEFFKQVNELRMKRIIKDIISYNMEYERKEKKYKEKSEDDFSDIIDNILPNRKEKQNLFEFIFAEYNILPGEPTMPHVPRLRVMIQPEVGLGEIRFFDLDEFNYPDYVDQETFPGYIDLPNMFIAENPEIIAGSAYIAIDGNASFEQTNGDIELNTFLQIGLNLNAAGSYFLNSGNLSSQSEIIGIDGKGSFYHFDGTNTVSDRLTIASNSSFSESNYYLYNGVLNVKDIIVGEQGCGSFTQYGGQHTAQYLFVGLSEGSRGLYTLDDGNLSVEIDTTIALLPNSFGEFIQTGGEYHTDILTLGFSPDSSGRFELSDGIICSQDTTIGYYGLGYFAQTGGDASLDNLFIGRGDRGEGEYNLSNGLLTTQNVYLGGYYESNYSIYGFFIQEGGKHNTDNIYIASTSKSEGVYKLSGGVLNVSGNIIGGDGLSSLIINGGALNIDGDISVNNEYIAYDTSASYTHLSGDTCLDNFFLGYEEGATGIYTLEEGAGLTVTSSVNDPDLSVLELDLGIEYIGYNGTAVFNHNGGNNSAFDVTVGYNLPSTGTYNLSGGSLNASYEVIGFHGTGTLIQTGDSFNDVHRLYIGHESGSVGEYRLESGILNSYREAVGINGEGNFIQNNGEHNVQSVLSLGVGGDGQGTFHLNNGILNTNITAVGQSGVGEFKQLSGIHNNTRLLVGLYSGSSGLYELKNGTLNVKKTIYLGHEKDSYGQFKQFGGLNNVNQFLIGNKSGAEGLYSISGGTLNVTDLKIGVDGNGKFIIHDSSSNINIAGSIFFGEDSFFSAVPDSSINMMNAVFDNHSITPGNLSGFDNLNIYFKEGTNFFEASSMDMGDVIDGFLNNFSVNSLVLNGLESVELIFVDTFDNQVDWTGIESVYIENLYLGETAVLNLNGVNLYCKNFVNNNGTVVYNGGSLIQILDDVTDDIDSSQFNDLSNNMIPFIPQAVPEPSLIVLFLFGFMFLGRSIKCK